MPQTNNETTILTENSKKNIKGEEHKKTWDALVYSKNIKSDEVLNVYKTWATAYQSDMDKVNPKKTEHVAQFAHELVKGDRKNPAELTVLDVAAGTGSVGVELVKYGFKNITATDYCQEMLDAAKEKGCYTEFVCCKFGTVIPKVLYPRKFDVVIMHGGFAAGHIPLSSLHTMARLCKKGGIVINSMSLQYTHFVEEYMDIHSYVQELVESGIWEVEFTRVLDNCMADRHALVHGFRVL
jgi:ubiquinone/menaquinone biosynthesis C-methylase UbiE